MSHDSKRGLSRRRFIVLASALVSSGALVACGDNTTTPAPATTLLAANLPPVELNFVYRAVPPPDLQLVQDELNKLLKAKINATVKLTPVEPSIYNEKMKVAAAAENKIDLVFTASWTNNYSDNVAHSFFLPLDDLLSKYAPKLYASMPPSTWNGVRIGGKIYAVINQINFAQPWGAMLRKDLVEKYKFDLGSVKWYEDLEPFLKVVKEGEGITPLYNSEKGDGVIFKPINYGYDEITATTHVVKADDPNLKVISYVDTPEFEKAVALAYKWYRAGYYPQIPPSQGDAVAAFKAGKFALQLHLTPPGNEPLLKVRYNYDFVQKPFTQQSYILTSQVTSNMLAIPRTSSNPERAMMLLELLNSDKVVFNTLAKGVEGKHWIWVDKANQVIGFPDGVNTKNSGYNPNTDYLFGSILNGYYIDKSQVGLWDQYHKVNQSARPSVALGFIPDLSKFSSEVSQITQAMDQYGLPLIMGVFPPERIGEYQAKLKQAGSEKVQAEVQRQIDEWKNTKASRV